MSSKKCFRYLWVLGIKLGGTRHFNSIEKLFVNKIDLVSENKYGPVALSAKMRTSVYKCFLKFDDGEKIILDEDTNKAFLFKRLKRYNQHLRTDIFDTTSHEAILVETGM